MPNHDETPAAPPYRILAAIGGPDHLQVLLAWPPRWPAPATAG
jgi:hypothetical protein